MNHETDRASSPTAHTITPHLVVGGAAQAADWYQQAFGAQVGSRIPVPGGKFIQIEVRLGDSRVMLADEFPDMGVLSPLTLGGTYGALDITTEDADALWDRAVAAGATVYQPLQDMFWGDRHGQVIDPFGHRWGISQHLRDVPPEEVTRAAAAMFGGDTGCDVFTQQRPQKPGIQVAIRRDLRRCVKPDRQLLRDISKLQS